VEDRIFHKKYLFLVFQLIFVGESFAISTLFT